MKCVLKGTNLADCSKNMPKPPGVKKTTLSVLNCAAQTGASGQCFSKGTWWKGSSCKDQGVAGFRIQKGGKVAYLYAKPGTAWVKNKSYHCPTGWHFGTQKEFHAGCKSGSGHNGHNKCGCSGYTCGGHTVYRFRYSDSKSNGGFAHMGSGECSGHSHDQVTAQFAGIICIKN